VDYSRDLAHAIRLGRDEVVDASRELRRAVDHCREPRVTSPGRSRSYLPLAIRGPAVKAPAALPAQLSLSHHLA
jgi:hypothetical protein